MFPKAGAERVARTNHNRFPDGMALSRVKSMASSARAQMPQRTSVIL
jgi:hypothetical protein